MWWKEFGQNLKLKMTWKTRKNWKVKNWGEKLQFWAAKRSCLGRGPTDQQTEPQHIYTTEWHLSPSMRWSKISPLNCFPSSLRTECQWSVYSLLIGGLSPRHDRALSLMALLYGSPPWNDRFYWIPRETSSHIKPRVIGCADPGLTGWLDNQISRSSRYTYQMHLDLHPRPQTRIFFLSQRMKMDPSTGGSRFIRTNNTKWNSFEFSP